MATHESDSQSLRIALAEEIEKHKQDVLIRDKMLVDLEVNRSALHDNLQREISIRDEMLVRLDAELRMLRASSETKAK